MKVNDKKPCITYIRHQVMLDLFSTSVGDLDIMDIQQVRGGVKYCKLVIGSMQLSSQTVVSIRGERIKVKEPWEQLLFRLRY